RPTVPPTATLRELRVQRRRDRPPSSARVRAQVGQAGRSIPRRQSGALLRRHVAPATAWPRRVGVVAGGWANPDWLAERTCPCNPAALSERGNSVHSTIFRATGLFIVAVSAVGSFQSPLRASA